MTYFPNNRVKFEAIYVSYYE